MWAYEYKTKDSWNWIKVKIAPQFTFSDNDVLYNVQLYCFLDVMNFTWRANTSFVSVKQQDEKQTDLIRSHFCFSGGEEVVVLVAVEAVQEAPQTPEDVKG